ncbi:hypothetical protein [Kineococcus sp. SYSU DK005]|uniref:hypothetical protein n=1 Tax=Kineococcus sp. SYSU DK005 TaxID=3383126 RepID=UPI003D7CEC94
MAVHAGAHHDTDVTCGELSAWVARCTSVATRLVRESYLAGWPDTADASAWWAQIAWAVFLAAAGAGTPSQAPAGGS